jgi:DNA invertase Pin-like site-specific DNA recombinase
MRKIGYARVSTSTQNVARQVQALKAEGCTAIFREHASGKSREKRPQLARAIGELREGDVFVVAEWDRATRSMMDGLSIIADVSKTGATVKVLDRAYFDLTTAMGRGMLAFVSALFEDERNRMLKRCQQGMKIAKANGVQFGPKKRALTTANAAEALRMRQDGESLRTIGKTFGVHHSTISKLVKASKN